MNAHAKSKKKHMDSGQERITDIWIYPSLREDVMNYIKMRNYLEGRFRKSRGEPYYTDARYKE